MYRSISLVFLLASFFIASFGHAQSTADVAEDLGNVTLLTNHKGKEVQLYQGYEIKVDIGTENIQGTLYKVEGDELLMFVYDRVRRVNLNQIKYIKTLNAPMARVLGGALKAFGVASLGFTGLTLAVGIIGLIAGDFAALLLVATPFLGI
ncbi:MAG: hypothetical protein ACPGWM_10220, partial [Flavobacteriales bacterium]